MKDLIILGLDIHAIEILDMVKATGEYNFIGFASQHAEYEPVYEGYPVLGDSSILTNYPSTYKLPMHVWKVRQNMTNWVNIIAPSAFITSTASLGVGCVIYPNCFIGADARLGNGIFMLSGSIVNHHCIIEDNVTICSGVILAGSVTVKTGAYLGQASSVKQLLTIGSNSKVGMGAVVTRNVADDVTVVGCPARPLCS